MVCGPGLPEVFHSLLYRSNRPSGVVHWPNGADEHQAHDAGLVLVVVCTWLGDVVAGTGFGLAVLGLDDALCTALGGEPDDGLDGEDGWDSGLGDDAGPDCAAQWYGADLAGHLVAAAADTRVSLPDARQAVTVTCWPDALHGLASFTVCGAWLSARSVAWVPDSAYPPTAAAASRDRTAARRTSFLGLL